jgi:ABC-2 type transport system permease protein
MSLLRSLRRMLSIARKEVRQLLRDPLTMGFVVGVPVVQLLLFGYAINQDVRHVATAVVDRSASHVSRQILGQLEATQTLRITHRPTREAAALDLLTRGEVDVVAVVPLDFATDYYRGRGAEISLRVNATDPLLARAVRSSVGGLEEEINRLSQAFVVEGKVMALRSSERREGAFPNPDLAHTQALRLSVVNLYNPELRTAVFVVPALLGVILTTTMILMTAVSIVRERERGTFEFLIATPVGRLELMVGKISPYVAIGILQVVLVLASGLLLFHVPVHGSLLDLGISSMVFIAANLTLGLLISSVSASQLQATQISFFFFLPSVLLSGFMFPFESMPRPAQWLGELLPLTHYIRNVKAILLRDSSLLEQLPDLLGMVLFFLFGLIGATLLFRKRLG